jgi:hypothetical protein
LCSPSTVTYLARRPLYMFFNVQLLGLESGVLTLCLQRLQLIFGNLRNQVARESALETVATRNRGLHRVK